MTDFVVVDASLAMKWVVVEPDSDEANALVDSWVREGVRMAAPYLLPVEIANGLHQHVRRGELTLEEAEEAIATFLASGVELLTFPTLHLRAMQLAQTHRLAAVYDSHYLALAESLDCDFWTADTRFHRAVASIGRVRLLTEA